MSITSQLSSLRRIRRQCPFLCREGAVGYMCGRNLGREFKMRNRCSLACPDILEKAQNLGLNVSINHSKLSAI